MAAQNQKNTIVASTRRTPTQVFFDGLARLSGTPPKAVNNETLRTEIGWTEVFYDRFKDGQIKKGAIVKAAAGRGGGIALPVTRAAKSVSPKKTKAAGKPSSSRPQAFISYSHKDEKYKDDLLDHLTTLVRKRKIAIWHDRELMVGDVLDAEIKSRLSAANLVIFLVSAKFLSSYYCYEVELKTALRLARKRGAKIVTIILRPSSWQDTPLARYVVLPKDGKPISRWSNKDEAFVDVAAGIDRIL